MSEGARSKLPWIATALAGIAVTCALAAVIVVLVRERPAPAPDAAPPPPPAVPALIDRRVEARDANRLRDLDSVEVVMRSGIPRGLRVIDPALAAALGLEPDDILTALSGRVLAGENDLRDALFTARSRRATTLYVEILRGATPTLLRWQIDGDLRGGSLVPGGTLGSSRPPWAPMPMLGSGGTPNAHDPLIDTIVKIDDMNFQVPRSTLDAIAGNPYRVLGTMRVIPSMKNGVPDGYKLYAIRPSTLIAQLGVRNGDTLHSIAGEDVSATADPTGVFDKLALATTVEIELTRRGRSVTLTYEITN